MEFKKKYDLIVVGSGPGGFPAAITASRLGLSVLVIERNPFFGGLMSSGLPPLAIIDRSGRKVIKGFAEEFLNRLRDIGAATVDYRAPIQNSLTYMNMSWVRLMVNEMFMESGVDSMLYAELKDVFVEDGKVCGVSVFCRGKEFKFDADLVIDATGDADVAFKAGARTVKGEHLQPATLTFDVENIDIDEFARYAQTHPETIKLPDSFPGIKQDPFEFGRDKTFATMCFFDLIEKAKAAGDFNLPRNMIDFTHQKDTDRGYFNVTRAINLDSTNVEQFIEGEKTCEHQIFEIMTFLRKYCPGFQNCTLGQVMPYLGIRESRRVVGKKTLTEEILETLPVPDDTVAMSGYNVDIHGQTSGVMTMLPVKHAIGIPMGCLIPERIENLIMSGRTISVDQTIFAMTRVMSACMSISEAAGVIAIIAHKTNVLPSNVDVEEVRRMLEAQGAVIR